MAIVRVSEPSSCVSEKRAPPIIYRERQHDEDCIAALA
jgi:hypothetical protein